MGKKFQAGNLSKPNKVTSLSYPIPTAAAQTTKEVAEEQQDAEPGIDIAPGDRWQ